MLSHKMQKRFYQLGDKQVTWCENKCDDAPDDYLVLKWKKDVYEEGMLSLLFLIPSLYRFEQLEPRCWKKIAYAKI